MTKFGCKILAKHKSNNARHTIVTTGHGKFSTPAFMPVGTRAGVNNMLPNEIIETNSEIILGGNTYHMLVEPGLEVIQQAGGMHKFMGWHGPMLTDSGGFQVFSLSKNKKICTIDEDGAHFYLPNSTKIIHMTPTESLRTQKIIGADIIMAFDQCTPENVTKDDAYKIMQRTHRWLLESIAYHKENPNSVYDHEQALFGIIQGGVYEDLRKESADFVTKQDLAGIAVGGESIGFNMPLTCEILRWVRDYLPEDKPIYSMGVGMSPQDLLDVIAEGVDMFDCVAPTRNARHGALYSGEIVKDGDWLKFTSPFPKGRLQIKKSEFALDFRPIMPGCECLTCKTVSRAALHSLFKQKSTVFTAYASIHNVHVMSSVCKAAKDIITIQQS